MTSIIWICIVIFSILSACIQSKLGYLTTAAMEGAEQALTLCLTIGGPLCLWSALSNVMEKSGLTEKLGLLLRPIFKKLFPNACKDPLASGYMTANISANFLGLGNAATPMGIKAVQRMKELQGTTVASNEMCRFIVLNTASIQLLPTTVAAIRGAAGSHSPFDILPAVWVTSLCSVTAGLLAAKILGRFYA